jgi:hypothetical protein
VPAIWFRRSLRLSNSFVKFMLRCVEQRPREIGIETSRCLHERDMGRCDSLYVAVGRHGRASTAN